MSDEENNSGMPLSPSYDPGDDDEEEAFPPSPTKDPADDDNEGFISSPSRTPDGDDGVIPSPTSSPYNYQEDENDDEEDSEERTTGNKANKSEFDWHASYDDSGQLYYYNVRTQESSWEPPEEGFNPPPQKKLEEHSEGQKNVETEEEDDAQSGSASPTTQPSGGEISSAWVLHQDAEGREYYYNTESGETQWERPEGFVTPDNADEITGVEATEHPVTMTPKETEQGEERKESPTSAAAPESETSPPTAWAAYKDEEGREYYYNADTGETQWEKPDGYVASAEDDKGAQLEQIPHPDESMDIESAKGTEINAEDMEEEKEPEEEVDPEILKLRKAQAALEEPDSVLERTCIANVTEVFESQGGNLDVALVKLVDSYQGQTAVCGLLGRWLARLRGPSHPKSESSKTSSASADAIRESIQDVINRIAKERFSKDVGDSILNLSREDASFLQGMVDSSRWRKLLIDLTPAHKESAVLKLCLKMISQQGYHREIARRIDLSNHFALFHQTLLSELTAIGRLAVSAGSDESSGFPEIVQDLERACTSTSHTYLYSLEMLRALTLSVAESQDSSPRFKRAVRKWQVLSQILDETMVDPASIDTSASPLFRKRRLDVALTLHELLQRQRKRQNTNGGSTPYEQALISFLRRHAVGIQVDDNLLDPMLPSGLDINAGRDVGNLLVDHPLAIRALLGHLYKPGQSRVTNPVTKNKCARLVALAVLAAEAKSKAENSSLGDDVDSDEVALTRMILQGAQLCEQLESMISFLVVSSSAGATAVQQPGQKLCEMCKDCPAVAQGVMVWAKEFTRGSEFVSSASFPTLSVSILSLVRLVATSQPFTRKVAIGVAVQFLGHTNSDISYQKISAIKEQSLRLLIFLLIQGEVVGVLDAVTDIVAKRKSSDLDASLIRYFVAGVVSVVQPPVSFTFARSLVQLLKAPCCVDAVRSKYFADENRVLLTNLLKSFQDLLRSRQDSLRKDDKALFESAISLYQVE